MASASIPPFKFLATSLKKTTGELDLAGTTNVVLRDTELRGLICRKQRRDWVFAIEKKIRGKIHRTTLSPYRPTTVNVAAVRAAAATTIGDMIAGTFSRHAAEATVRDDLARMTVAEAVDLHARVNPHLRASTLESYRYGVGYLTGGARVLMRDLTPDYIRAAYARMCETRSPATANQMLRSVKALWNTWADEHPDNQVPGRNPVSRVRGVRRTQPREGALSPDQRNPWFEAVVREVNRRGPTATAYAALGMMFLTGMRAQEVLGLSWSEVGNDGLTVAGERMKAGDALSRPVTPAMKRLLTHQRKFQPDSQWVFPARVGNGHMADVRKALRPINESVGVSITPHDLRRTFIATATLAGIPDVAIKMLVGHTTTDVTEVYAKALRTELPRLALKIEEELLT